MNADELWSICTLNFFCGLHLLVGMADAASTTLLQWEQAHFEESVGAAAFSNTFKKSNLELFALFKQQVRLSVSMLVNKVVYTNCLPHFVVLEKSVSVFLR